MFHNPELQCVLALIIQTFNYSYYTANMRRQLAIKQQNDIMQFQISFTILTIISYLDLDG